MIDDLSLLLGLALSNHTCIQFTYACYTPVSGNHIPKFNIYCVDYYKLQNLLSNIDWNKTIGDLKILDAWDYFFKTFNSFLQQSVPMTTVRHKNNIYITREVRFIKNKRNCLWKKYIKSHSDSDYTANTKSRNALCTLTRNLCRNFERQIAGNIGKNPKCFWSYVKSRVKTCMNIGSIEGMDGQLHHSDCTKANVFNNFFLVCLFMKTPICTNIYHR